MMTQISPRLFYLPFDDEADRPNLGYIRGDNYALMVDAGNSAAHVALFANAREAAGLKAPDAAVLTHWHWDHVFGAHALPCPVIAHRQTNAYIGEVAQWAWTEAAMAERLRTGADNDFCDRTIRVEYPDRSQITLRPADLVFDHRLTLSLGGVTCELLHIECPHTADSVIIWIPEERFVFLGDADCQGNHHNRASLYKPKLRELMETMKTLDFDMLLPGHEPPMTRQAAFDAWQAELNA